MHSPGEGDSHLGDEEIALLLQNPKIRCRVHSSPCAQKSPPYFLNQNNYKEYEANLYARETVIYKIISSIIKSPIVGKDASLIK
jgi:hypothetical protein